MAIIITNPYGPELDDTQHYWLYAGNDVLGTRQAYDVLHPQLSGDSLTLYNCAFSFQQPCLAMGLRGIQIDERERRAAELRCEADEAAAIEFLNEHEVLKEMWDVVGARSVSQCDNHPSGGRHNWTPRGADPGTQVCKHCGGPRLVTQEFNPHSSPQCAHLLYDLLSLKRRYSKRYNPDGTRPVTTDDEALEALARKYPDHADLLDRILSAKKLRKQLGVLRARRDADGRWRSSSNVCAAETGRMSSSKSPYRTGGNAQNIANKNRGIFVADAGLELWYADLEQAESKIVAYSSDCPQDIEDHESGNTHVGLARTLFPSQLRWDFEGEDWKHVSVRSALHWKRDKETGEWPAGLVTAKQICEQPLPWKPDHDYYRIAKVVRHGPLHPDCECLTPRGWVSVADQPRIVASRQSDGRTQWEVVTWVVGEADGLVHLEGRNVSQLSTPEHRIFAAYREEGQFKDWAAFEIGPRHRIPTTGILQGCADAPDNVAVQLLAATWCDGHKDGRRFTFKKPRKIERLRQLLRDAAIDWSEHVRGDGATEFRLARTLRKNLGWDLLDWPVKSRLLFLDELRHWDGNHANGGTLQISSVDYEGASIVQTAATLSGRSGSLRAEKRGPRNDAQRMVWVLTISDRVVARATRSTAVSYRGLVYCARTSAGYFWLRHNNKITTTGNTNIGMSAAGLQRQIHSDRKTAQALHAAYFDRYPENLRRQLELRRQVREEGRVVGPLGNVRTVLGRLWEDDTQRQLLAQVQQSTVAWMISLAMWRIWYEMDGRLNIGVAPRTSDPNRVWLLAPVHDAILGLRRPGDDDAMRRVKEIMECPVWIGDHLVRIGAEVAVGKSWLHDDLRVLKL